MNLLQDEFARGFMLIAGMDAVVILCGFLLIMFS